MKFHRRCGDRVTLLNDNSTAIRNFVEFNHGLILSAEPLKDDVIFEVCIDRKVNVWNGSLEIGVTTLDPEYMELPATATKLRNTAWILSGSSIVKDGITLVNPYGPELDSLREGDCIGVTRTNKAELLFYVNGRCLGVAARDLPTNLFAVIDLYGQCVQVSIIQTNAIKPIMDTVDIDQVEEDPNNDDSLTEVDIFEGTSIMLDHGPKQLYAPMLLDGACALVAQDRLRFHPRCGILVKLSANNKSAERARPLDDYNNGVVMTHRPLYENELFEIRIDRLVDKWSGSIEVGVTTHNPATIRFPSTMTNMETGTIMMSGCKVLFNGHGTCLEYGSFNLDELREGDTVGMMRKSNGKLHYFINGVDQGVATDKVEQHVWGVVDLYGMTVKVSIVDPCEDMESNVPINIPATPEPSTSRCRPQTDEDSLLFHTLRDSNVIIINDGKTAHRPNAFELFNNGIVMTNRTLKTNELFQVRLDLIIPKWAGSIEIGVTQHSSKDIEIPFRMSNAKSGTWAVTGEDVIHDGSVIIPQYVRNLNRLVEGDTVGVMRKDVGILHFYVNGVDQGPAAFNVPDEVFGIVDLYGRVAQATIVDSYTPPPVYTPESPLSTESNGTLYPEMCFHRVHGRNGRLSRNRLTASRATVYSEFNDAVMFSSRPLRECDMFELRIDKIVDCWIGSLEIGVTAIRPDDLETTGGVGAVAGTATDLNWDTYILSGAAMMKDGECVRSGYPLDLDTLNVGSRVGMMWHADRSIHYYLDGMDMGKAWYVPHLNIYAVVDLYGQCTQVTILQNEERAFNYNGCTNSENSLLSNSRPMSSPPPPYWSFSEYCGNNIILKHDYSIAGRLTLDPMAAIVFSSAHLVVDEIFEIRIVECKSGFAGSFRMGVTDVNILNANVNRHMPPAIKFLPHFTAYVDGRYMKYSRPGTVKEQDVLSFTPSFEWLRPGDRVGLVKTADARVVIYYNSEPLDIAFENVPDKVYVVMEIFGSVTKIQAVTRGNNAGTNSALPPIPIDDCVKEPPTKVKALSTKPAAPVTNTRSNIECYEFPEYLDTYSSNVNAENDLAFYLLAFHELPFNEISFEDSPANRSPVNDPLNDKPPIFVSPANSDPLELFTHIGSLFDEQPFDEASCCDPPSYDPLPCDPLPCDPLPYDTPCYDSPCYNHPCYDQTVYAPPCYDQPCYDPPCEDTPSNGTPCNEASFSDPSDKDAPHNMPVAKESQLKKARNVSPPSEPLCRENSLNDFNEPMSSKTPLVESIEDGRSSSELPINESPINDESSLIDLPFSDLSDNETPPSDPLVLVSDSPIDEPQLDEKMNKAQKFTEQPSKYLPVSEYVSELPVKELSICDPTANEAAGLGLLSEESVDKPEVSEAVIDKHVTCEAPLDKLQVSEVPVEKPAAIEISIVENKPVVCKDIVDKPTQVPLDNSVVVDARVYEPEVSEDPVDKPKVSKVPGDKPVAIAVPIDKPLAIGVQVSKSIICKTPIDKLENIVVKAPVDKLEVTEDPVDKSEDNKVLVDKLCVSEVLDDNSVTSGDYKSEVSEAPADKIKICEVSVDKTEASENLLNNTKVVEALVNNKSGFSDVPVSRPNSKLSTFEPHTSKPHVTETKINEVLADAVAIINDASTSAPTESNIHSSAVNAASESLRRHRPLPYTFHYNHGKNIKLCSSDTVAVRTTGYKHGITIVSQPLRRGHEFRFRVDKLNTEWAGGATIGAIGYLPTDDLPSCAMHLDPPIWILSSEVLQDNGSTTSTNMASELDELCERSVLTIHFRFNSDIVIAINGKMLGSIGTVPRMYSHIFPLIDLYGRVKQVSVLLHPNVIMCGTSLDLPIIAENRSEESFAELDFDEHDSSRADLSDPLIVPEILPKRNNKAFSHDNLIDGKSEPIIAQPGPSSIPDPVMKVSLPFEKEVTNNEIRYRKIGTNRISLHHSLILSDKCIPVNNNEMVNRCLQKSHSTQSFCHVADESLLATEVKDALQHTFSASCGFGDEDIVIHGMFDTNIRHNDRYPEANDVDNLDNEIMDALTLETGNLPDLTEEQSSSFDDSTRRDDYWSEPLVVENLIYLNRILCLDQDGAEGQSLGSEWEASGEGCEHLHLALKYWNYLVLPYPELRQAVLWGQVRCYCSNCQPEAPEDLADWVRIERIDGVGATQRAFWHVVRSTLGSAQAVASEPGPSRRPRSLAAAPSTSPTYADIWFDEEGKPHHTVLAIEIDIEGSEPESDRLLAFLIYLKTNVVFLEDNPLSLDE